MRTLTISGALVLLLVAAPVLAKSPDITHQRSRSIWITEFGPGIKLDNDPFHFAPPEWDSYSRTDRDPNWYLLTHLGYLRRVSDKDAVGGTVFFGGNDRRMRFGLKGRYRRDLSQSFSVELSPGLVLAGWNDYTKNQPDLKPQLPTPVASLSLNYRDVLIPTLEMELDRTQRDGSDTRWYGVLEVGSKPGVIMGITTIVVGGIALAAVASSMDGFMR